MPSRNLRQDALRSFLHLLLYAALNLLYASLSSCEPDLVYLMYSFSTCLPIFLCSFLYQSESKFFMLTSTSGEATVKLFSIILYSDTTFLSSFFSFILSGRYRNDRFRRISSLKRPQSVASHFRTHCFIWLFSATLKCMELWSEALYDWSTCQSVIMSLNISVSVTSMHDIACRAPLIV